MTYSKWIASNAKKICTYETLLVDRFDLRGFLENVRLYRTQASLAVNVYGRQIQAVLLKFHLRINGYRFNILIDIKNIVIISFSLCLPNLRDVV